MDLLCVELSERLIDDIPAHDPRWAELNKTGKSLNSNFIISKQLNGKIRMHEYYINFLKTFQLWQNVFLRINLKLLNDNKILYLCSWIQQFTMVEKYLQGKQLKSMAKSCNALYLFVRICINAIKIYWTPLLSTQHAIVKICLQSSFIHTTFSIEK